MSNLLLVLFINLLILFMYNPKLQQYHNKYTTNTIQNLVVEVGKYVCIQSLSLYSEHSMLFRVSG